MYKKYARPNNNKWDNIKVLKAIQKVIETFDELKKNNVQFDLKKKRYPNSTKNEWIDFKKKTKK